METSTDLADSIKACRTCGIHFVTPSEYQLKHLFQSCQEHSEIMLIRLELAQWNIVVSENDGYPQYICNTCIHKFEQIFQLRTACINAQNEFRKFYAVPNGNITNIKIKTEVPDENDETEICDFIYVDELTDGDYDGATPFNIPHIPIKEEVIEAAAVPIDDLKQSLDMVESASRVVIPTDKTQVDSVNVCQTDAMLQMSPHVVECNLCHHISSNQEDHKHHMQAVHDIRDLECHICGKEFKNSTSARLKFHIKWHTLNKPIKCNLCGFICKSKDALNLHKRTNHRKINCKICGKGVLAKKIKSHVHQHELQQKYACEYCTKAFATEIERENHIWRIHAAEDDSGANSLINHFQTRYANQVDANILDVKQDENMMCQEVHGNFLYKYICAHCEHRFVNQMDLETHVAEDHRGVHLTTFEQKNAMFIDKDHIDTVQNECSVFEKYDDNVMQATNIIDPPINSSVLAQDFIPNPTSNIFATNNENIHKDDKKLLSCSSSDEDYDTTEVATGASNLSTYVDGHLNTFACAKCSETFAAIEQLREHHQQHLAAEQHKPKPKFKCSFCEKMFDLKFRLNRHVNKHKNYAPL